MGTGFLLLPPCKAVAATVILRGHLRGRFIKSLECVLAGMLQVVINKNILQSMHCLEPRNKNIKQNGNPLMCWKIGKKYTSGPRHWNVFFFLVSFWCTPSIVQFLFIYMV